MAPRGKIPQAVPSDNENQIVVRVQRFKLRHSFIGITFSVRKKLCFVKLRLFDVHKCQTRHLTPVKLGNSAEFVRRSRVRHNQNSVRFQPVPSAEDQRDVSVVRRRKGSADDCNPHVIIIAQNRRFVKRNLAIII